jgi:ribosome-associated protein
MLVISSRIRIADDELQFTFVRSSGPGGQNVNKLNTKAVLRWSVRASGALPEDVRERFLHRYRHRVTVEGDFLLSSQRFRDQRQNQRDCLEKLREMLSAVAVPPKPRKPTKPTRSSRQRHRTDKRIHGQKKQSRRPPSGEE